MHTHNIQLLEQFVDDELMLPVVNITQLPSSSSKQHRKLFARMPRSWPEEHGLLTAAAAVDLEEVAMHHHHDSSREESWQHVPSSVFGFLDCIRLLQLSPPLCQFVFPSFMQNRRQHRRGSSGSTLKPQFLRPKRSDCKLNKSIEPGSIIFGFSGTPR